MNQKQQGDVLFIKIAEIPDGATELNPENPEHAKYFKNGKLVLALGEATGHAHTIEAKKAFILGSTIYFMVADKPVVAEHNTHHDVMIEPGIWESGQVVEIDPFEEEIRRVSD